MWHTAKHKRRRMVAARTELQFARTPLLALRCANQQQNGKHSPELGYGLTFARNTICVWVPWASTEVGLEQFPQGAMTMDETCGGECVAIGTTGLRHHSAAGTTCATLIAFIGNARSANTKGVLRQAQLLHNIVPRASYAFMACTAFIAMQGAHDNTRLFGRQHCQRQLSAMELRFAALFFYRRHAAAAVIAPWAASKPAVRCGMLTCQHVAWRLFSS